MIIDMRCRLTIPEAGNYFMDQSKRTGNRAKVEAFAGGTVEEFFQEIGKYGITTAVSVSGNNPGMRIGRWNLPDRTTSNDLMARLQKEYWGRFVGVAGIDAGNVFHNAIDEIERCYQMGLCAVFIEPAASPAATWTTGGFTPSTRSAWSGT